MSDAEVLAARWRLGDIAPSDLRVIASDLLDAGESAPALVHLFALRPEWVAWEGPELFEQALLELGAPDRTDLRDGEVVAWWLARRLLDRSIGPREVCEVGTRLYIASDYEEKALEPYYSFDDEYGWNPPSEAVDRKVLRFAEAIVARSV